MFINNMYIAIIAKWYHNYRRFCTVLLFESNQIEADNHIIITAHAEVIYYIYFCQYNDKYSACCCVFSVPRTQAE